MKITRSSFLNTMEEEFRGACCADYMTKSEMRDYIKDVKKFLKHAKTGDAYWYDGNMYTLVEDF